MNETVQSQYEQCEVLDVAGHPAIIGRILPESTVGPAQLRWVHDPARPTHLHWDRYCDWRVSKCEPRRPDAQPEELDQAIHEFVGEVAELGELIADESISVLGETFSRHRLIDEIGDIFFTGCWILDALRLNFLRDEPDIDFGAASLLDGDSLDAAKLIREKMATPDQLDKDDTELFEQALYMVAFTMGWTAGLLCNWFKKARWHNKSQDPCAAASRVLIVFMYCLHLLTMLGSGVSDALAVNIEKLDARYPDGFVGPGGGIRTGKGA